MLVLALLALGAPTAHAQAPDASSSPAGSLTKPPSVLQFVEAPIPDATVPLPVSVVLAVTIRADGAVEEVTVHQSATPADPAVALDPAPFDAAATEAVRQFVFSPAEIDGKPARIRILYEYRFEEKLIAPTTAIFEGVVLDRETKAPLPGVTITLTEGENERFAVTDEQGRFSFEDVTPGTLAVSLQGERLPLTQTEETFVAGERLEASYEVFLADPEEEVDDLNILVSAPTLKKEAVSTAMGAEDAVKIPGTTGDVLRVVENMPGVARASLGTGALVVWGAAPDETGVYVDGVPVPRLYHDSGLRSVVGSDFVKSVELVPGGYGAAYGRAIGGLVSVTTQRFDQERDRGLHASGSTDLYDTALSVHGLLKDRVSFGVGGRYGYVGPLLSAFSPDVQDFFPVPHYTDTQARLGVKLRPGETLDLTGLTSSDWTRRTAPNPDPAREAAEERRLTFQRLYLRYARDLGDGSTVSAVLYAGADQSSQVGSFGPLQTSIETDVLLVGARANVRQRLSETFTLEGGLDAYLPRTTVTRRGSVAVPSREGDIRVFGQPPPDQISSDAFTVTTASLAPYLEGELLLLEERLRVVGGLRFDPYARSVSRAAPQVGISPTNGLFLEDFRAEPRLAVRLDPTEWSHLTFAGGFYGQPPQAADLSASFGNPALPSPRARHLVVGGGLTPLETLGIDVTVFRTTSEQLAMRNLAEQPSTAEALVASGSGRSQGIQTLLRLDRAPDQPGGVFGWLSYTLAWSARRNAPDTDWRPSDYDQRHVLTTLGGYEWKGGFELGLRVRLASGFPRTEVLSSFYDSRRDLYQPVFGPQNQLRLPTFFQADLRAAQHFDLGEDGELDLSLEIQNVSNQENAEEFVYDADYQTRGAIRGLPILPVLGVRWSF